MVYGIFHKGSGLGNQLHRYVATRVLALDKGYGFGMVAPELFKGKSFMNLDMGIQASLPYKVEEPSGKVIPIWKYSDIIRFEEWDKFTYDPDFNFVQDNTIIDGSFEDERYFEHRMDEINEWLKTEPLEIPDDVCVIGFRGGEYYTVPELGLPKEYFERAIHIMKGLNPNMKFEVHTDDPSLAREFFGGKYSIIHDIEKNWQAVRYAKYAIIANSSFYVLPRLLVHHERITKPVYYLSDLKKAVTIAPHYWNRYNIKKWDYPQSYYKQFKYIHHEKM